VGVQVAYLFAIPIFVTVS
jgi:hypothetical protein